MVQGKEWESFSDNIFPKCLKFIKQTVVNEEAKTVSTALLSDIHEETNPKYVSSLGLHDLEELNENEEVKLLKVRGDLGPEATNVECTSESENKSQPEINQEHENQKVNKSQSEVVKQKQENHIDITPNDSTINFGTSLQDLIKRVDVMETTTVNLTNTQVSFISDSDDLKSELLNEIKKVTKVTVPPDHKYKELEDQIKLKDRQIQNLNNKIENLIRDGIQNFLYDAKGEPWCKVGSVQNPGQRVEMQQPTLGNSQCEETYKRGNIRLWPH